jgi:hypothetical protein
MGRAVLPVAALAAWLGAAAAPGTQPGLPYRMSAPPGWREAGRELRNGSGQVRDIVFFPAGPVTVETPFIFTQTVSDPSSVRDPTDFAFTLRKSAEEEAKTFGTAFRDLSFHIDAAGGRIVMDYNLAEDGVVVRHTRTTCLVGRREVVLVVLVNPSSDPAGPSAVFDEAVKSVRFEAGHEPWTPAEAAEAPASRRIDTAAHHYHFHLPMAWTRFPPRPGGGTGFVVEHRLLAGSDSSLQVPQMSVAYKARALATTPESFSRQLRAEAASAGRTANVVSSRDTVTFDAATSTVYLVTEREFRDQPPLTLHEKFFLGKEGVVDVALIDRRENLPLHEPAFEALCKSVAFEPGYTYGAGFSTLRSRLLLGLAVVAVAGLVVAGIVVGVVFSVRGRG